MNWVMITQFTDIKTKIYHNADFVVNVSTVKRQYPVSTWAKYVACFMTTRDME